MSSSLITSMKNLVVRFKELGEQLSSPEVLSNPSLISKIAKEHAALEPKVKTFQAYQVKSAELNDALKIIDEEEDREMLELAKEEAQTLEREIAGLEDDMKIMLLPKDPLDSKDIIIEIRAGTGGEEAALFAAELYRMYSHFADSRGWKVEELSTSSAEAGGVKEIIFSISGEEVYSQLKYESGVHRVQRVPVTESQGRIHTSAASVVVMPEAENITIEINSNDLKIDVYRSSGPGGQSVNTTDSAVRITHIPTGITVSCQDEKSQLKNKTKAMKVLRAKLYDRARAEQHNSRSEQRKSMVGSGDRSAKIRTYNFPQGRVTDHRIGLTLHRLDGILAGNLDELIEAIRLEDQRNALEEQTGKPVG